MCATPSNLQAELKKSPMFNLSLSSKELFHSNMLAWIAEDEDTKDLFVEILKLFGLKKKDAEDIAKKIRKDEYMVLREYKNFDLCICEKVDAPNTVKGYKEGQILLVLENKFKSIPYKAQLLKYQGEVANLNIEVLKVLIRSKGGKPIRTKKLEHSEQLEHLEQLRKENKINKITPHFVLLSLTQNAYEFDFNTNPFKVENCDWHYVSYEKYAELLLNDSSVKDFKADVIKDYANYILEFSSYLNHKLSQFKTGESWTKTLAPNDDLKPIRMDDIWQKLIANLILIELCKKGIGKLVKSPDQYSVGTKTENFVELQDKSVVHVGAGLSRASGLVEIKINIGDKCVFGVQIQGGLYKRLLETTKNRLPTNTSGQIAYYTPKLNVLSDMFRLNKTDDWYVTHKIFDNSQPLYPKWTNKKAGLQGFGGYDNTFIAQWMKISKDATVGQVIAAMIEDCMEVREIFSKVNGTTNP